MQHFEYERDTNRMKKNGEIEEKNKEKCNRLKEKEENRNRPTMKDRKDEKRNVKRNTPKTISKFAHSNIVLSVDSY